ncbi:MAG: response regulator [Candidatus Omnitrophica bacterium]|nr:response regulator [Candidatus Omnitrophota bacterium]
MIDHPLTTGEIADFCHVTDRAVLKWVDEGKLKAYRTPGNHSRVNVEDFLKFLKEYSMPIPPELEEDGAGQKKILIVDDDREMVSAFRRALMGNKKYTIDVAYDGFAAGQKFADFKPDLILLDVKMPGIDGYEVVRRLRADPAGKDVKVIIISGTLDMDSVERIVKAGANDFLSKPFRNEYLRLKVDRMLGII